MHPIITEDYILSYKKDTGEPILTPRDSDEEISLKEYPLLEQFYKQELNHERYKNRQYAKRTCSLALTYSNSDNASDLNSVFQLPQTVFPDPEGNAITEVLISKIRSNCTPDDSRCSTACTDSATPKRNMLPDTVFPDPLSTPENDG